MSRRIALVGLVLFLLVVAGCAQVPRASVVGEQEQISIVDRPPPIPNVMNNGNLRVRGEKQIAINQGTEFIRFSGVVNPRTITAQNTVPSTQVADARIEYVGDGYINEAQHMGWLQRFFLNVSPF